ncbi:hypothetical protein A2U01_0101214, partial [Trifolium medium]|nr:hypothetical protein [Trifolium medium]
MTARLRRRRRRDYGEDDGEIQRESRR